MKKTILTIFVFTLYFTLTAQVDTGGARMERTGATAHQGGTVGFGIATMSQSSNYSTMRSYGGSALKENTVGSPFLYDENFLPGSILEDDKVLAPNVALRYNVIDDIFEAKLELTSEDNTAQVIKKSKEYHLKIGNRHFIPLEYDGKLQYFESIYTNNNYTLYKQHRKKFTPEIQATSSMTRSVPPTFKTKEVLFLMDAEGNLQEVPSSKKKAIKIFTGREDDVKKIIKDKRLNVSKEKDLVILLKALN